MYNYLNKMNKTHLNERLNSCINHTKQTDTQLIYFNIKQIYKLDTYHQKLPIRNISFLLT